MGLKPIRSRSYIKKTLRFHQICKNQPEKRKNLMKIQWRKKSNATSQMFRPNFELMYRLHEIL